MIAFFRKSAVTIMGMMLACGCHLNEEALRGAEDVRKASDAIFCAYKDIWHSFYDEENLSRMLVVNVDVASDGTTILGSYYDVERRVYRERIVMRINEQAYLEWKTNAEKMLEDAGADAYIVNDMGNGCRAICGRAYQFPEEIESRLAEFDWIVDEERLERFVIKATLFDRDKIPVSSITVPDYKFYMRGGGWCSFPYSLPFHRLSRVKDLFLLYGDRKRRELDFCADIEFENIDDYENERYRIQSNEFEIKKEYDPLSYASVSDTVGSVVLNIISNMVPILGEEYLVCRYEVTQGEWRALMGSNPSGDIGVDKPVENIAWFDARLFVDVINSLPETKAGGLKFFIPSLEEWSYACFGNRDSALQYKASKTGLDAKGWFSFNSNGLTHEVGLKDYNPFGLYDMLGNVYEYSCDTRERVGYLSRYTACVICGGSFKTDADWMNEDNECPLVSKCVEVGLRLFAVSRKRKGQGYRWAPRN